MIYITKLIIFLNVINQISQKCIKEIVSQYLYCIKYRCENDAWY